MDFGSCESRAMTNVPKAPFASSTEMNKYIFWYGTVTFMSTQMAPLHPTSIQGFAAAGAAAAAG